MRKDEKEIIFFNGFDLWQNPDGRPTQTVETGDGVEELPEKGSQESHPQTDKPVRSAEMLLSLCATYRLCTCA